MTKTFLPFDVNTANQIILKIDSAPEILNFQSREGLSFWLLIRHYLFRNLINHEKRNPGGFKDTKAVQRIKHLNFLLRRILNNPLSIKREYDCLNFCSSVSVIKTTSGVRNKTSGFLLDLKWLKVLNIFSSFNLMWPQKIEGDYAFADSLFSKKLHRQSRFNRELSDNITSFLKYIEKIEPSLANPIIIKLIFNYLFNSLKGESESIKKITRLINNTKPKLIIVEDGNYGGTSQCSIILVSKKMNIPTIEIQHGIFDIAYTYSKELLKNEIFKTHKTDFVLTFGDYFSNYIKSSSCNVSIGNYFLETKMQSFQNTEKSGGIQILFISQTSFTNDLILIVKEALLLLNKEFKLVIRLHPSEGDNVDRYNDFLNLKNVKFSHKGDLYEELKNADVIIGSFSTVLFEACFFGKVPFVHDNDLSRMYVPKDLGLRFITPKDLLNLINSTTGIKSSQRSFEKFFKAGCKENFRNFYLNYIDSKKKYNEKIGL